MNRALAALAFLLALAPSASLCASAPAEFSSVEALLAEREARLTATLAELHAQRETIQTERLPLLQTLRDLEAGADRADHALHQARHRRERHESRRESLRREVETLQRALGRLERTAFPSYFADYEADLSVGERLLEGTAVRAYQRALTEPASDPAAQLDAALALLRASTLHANSRLGGKRFGGKALDPDGVMQPGTFLQFGPVLYFAPESTATTGGLILATPSLHPQIHPLKGAATRALADLATTGSGTLPLDLSLGDALALESTKDSFREHLAKGGIWVYPILLFALAAATVALLKTIQVFTLRHPDPGAIQALVRALRRGDATRARALATAQPEPARAMLLAAVEHAGESTEMVEEVMYESMLTTQPRLERFLNVIAVTAATAPLLGLLGTVTGIIKTFQLMRIYGAGDPAPLISGISEALITTELGLILAIPALVLHALLSRKVAGTMARLEKTAIMLVNGLARRGVEREALEP